MSNRSLRYSWRWDMPAPTERVWPLVSDTHSFNRAIGVGPWTFTETPDSHGGSRREGALGAFGIKITWDENPFRWVEGREFSVLRDYHNGPFLKVLTSLSLEPATTGSVLTYGIEAEPRSFLWSPIARYYLGVHMRKRLDGAFRQIERFLEGQGEAPYLQPSPGLSATAQDRLRRVQTSLVDAGFERAVAEGLTGYVKEADESSCHRIKPYALADVWGQGRDSVLRACLSATRLGMLDLSWDLMCPLCRGAKGSVSSLSEQRNNGHCFSCNIQFDANFDRSVEVTFRPPSR